MDKITETYKHLANGGQVDSEDLENIPASLHRQVRQDRAKLIELREHGAFQDARRTADGMAARVRKDISEMGWEKPAPKVTEEDTDPRSLAARVRRF